MKKSIAQKIWIWVILILTSAGLIIPSVAVLWGIFQSQSQQNYSPNTISVDINDVEQLKNLGYDDEQIANIKQGLQQSQASSEEAGRTELDENQEIQDENIQDTEPSLTPSPSSSEESPAPSVPSSE